MLTIKVPLGEEQFNNETQEFFYSEEFEVELEHSLVSLSKWEQIHEKPFLSEDEKTNEEIFDYIRCMIVTPNLPPAVFHNITEENMAQINDYINAKRTATWFNDNEAPKTRTETITAELVYYWMSGFNIPWEAQYWHLNTLFTLIKVHNAKSEKPKKMSRAEIAERNRKLNAERLAKYNTTG